MQPEGKLLCSQEPSTGSYPEPDQSTHLRLGPLVVSFLLSGLPTNNLYAFLLSPIRAISRARLILPDLIILIKLCYLRALVLSPLNGSEVVCNLLLWVLLAMMPIFFIYSSPSSSSS
jgi:hypothetical protein